MPKPSREEISSLGIKMGKTRIMVARLRILRRRGTIRARWGFSQRAAREPAQFLNQGNKMMEKQFGLLWRTFQHICWTLGVTPRMRAVGSRRTWMQKITAMPWWLALFDTKRALFGSEERLRTFWRYKETKQR